MTSSTRRRRFLCTLLIVGLPPLMLAGAWRLGGVSALEDDLIYYRPIRTFIGDSIRAGAWPFWNPYVALGTSVAADPQSGLWYPPTWLFVALPALWALPVTLCLHFALAGGGMYRFLRAIGRAWPAALLGAIAFEFCGFIVGHRAHLTIFEAAAWLPWMLYAWHRFATTGRRGFFIFAVLCLGVQMLVQHVQITIIGGAILTAYVVAFLTRSRRSLLWEYPAGLLLGGLIGAVQLVPTFVAFARCGRNAPAYYLFIENSYTPTSLFMWLFPFIYGSRTPNFYDHSWWGWSHLCEQATYTSIGILVLAIASIGLWRRDRQVRFWWLVAIVAMVVAFGEFTPASRVLFHIPVLRSLRVPARWVLGLDLAFVVLAATLLDALIRGGPDGDAARRWLKIVATRVLPATAALALLCMVVARAAAGDLFTDKVAASLDVALRPGNPAVWIPLILMAATVAASLILCRSARAEASDEGAAMPALRGRTRPVTAGPIVLMFAIVLVDLASFVAFVDVDTRDYPDARSLAEAPPLAREIAARSAAPGERLWVPRVLADYSRPVEVLSPQLNVAYRIPVLNGYGPLWPVETRSLLHFMPWGAAQDALGLLYNPKLLQSLGVRWLAARADQERDLMSLALAGPPSEVALPECGDVGEVTLRGIEWHTPVSIPTPGVYAVEFRASPGLRNQDRWYLWLTSASDDKIGETLWYEPTDFALGPRTVRGFFICRESSPGALIHAYGEPRCDVTISAVRFGRIADWPPAPPVPGPYRRVADLPDGVTLYELTGSRPRYAWAAAERHADTPLDVVERLRFQPDAAGLPSGVMFAGPGAASDPGQGTIEVLRENNDHVILNTANDRGGILVFNEAFDPGWCATIDGTSTETLRANAVLQAVRVPAGGHRIEFRYWPQGLRPGLILSAVGLLAIAAWVVLNRRTGRT